LGTRGKGRPPLPGESRKRRNLSLRVRDQAREALARAAAQNQRTISEEIEARLEQSLSGVEQALEFAYGARIAGLVVAIARAMHDTATWAGVDVFGVTPIADRSVVAAEDPWVYDQMTKAVGTVLEAFRPKGAIVEPALGRIVEAVDSTIETSEARAKIGIRHAGELQAQIVVRAIEGEGDTDELKEWGRRRRAQLGNLVKSGGST